MLLIIAGLCFLVVLSIFFLLHYYLSTDKRDISKRVGNYVKERHAYISIEQINSVNHTASGRTFIRSLSKYFEHFSLSRVLEHKLLQAGLILRGSEFMVICSGVSIIRAIAFLALTGGSFFGGICGAAAGGIMPFMILNYKIAKRMKAFNNQLGDVLMLMANSLRTGYSFMQALDMVASEMPPPISLEIGRVLKEMNFGITTEDALNNLAKRVNSDDLDLVITAVLIQRQVGGNLAEVLDNIAGTIRSRIKMKGEVKTLTAQGRISGLVVGMLPIALGFLIYLINPQYIMVLFTHPAGRMMLLGAFVSQVLGIIMIRKIIDIEL